MARGISAIPEKFSPEATLRHGRRRPPSRRAKRFAPRVRRPNPGGGEIRSGCQAPEPDQWGSPLRARGFPLGARGFPLGARGFPLHARGFPLHARGFPHHARGFPLHARGCPARPARQFARPARLPNPTREALRSMRGVVPPGPQGNLPGPQGSRTPPARFYARCAELSHPDRKAFFPARKAPEPDQWGFPLRAQGSPPGPQGNLLHMRHSRSPCRFLLKESLHRTGVRQQVHWRATRRAGDRSNGRKRPNRSGKRSALLRGRRVTFPCGLCRRRRGG